MDKDAQRKSISFTVGSNVGLLNALYTDCGITVAYDPASGGTQPSGLTCRALWDTGATGSVISKRLAAQLNLTPTGMCQAHTANGSCNVSTYLVNIHLPNNVAFPFVQVTDADLNGFDVLIGMDIITRGDFAITNFNGKTKFSFQIPSTHDIDFVEEHNALFKPTAPIRNVGRKIGVNEPCPCKSGLKYKRCCGKRA